MAWKRALIIEEGHGDLSALQESLKKKGFLAHFAESAPDALAYAGNHNVDLILTREVVGRDKDGGAVLLTQLRDMGVNAPAILYGTRAGQEKLEMVRGQNASVSDDIKDRALKEHMGKVIDGFSAVPPKDKWADQVGEEALVSAARGWPS